MRRPRHKLQVSTFPFLAVLLGAMGALILLLLVMDRRSKIVARNKALEIHSQLLAKRAKYEELNKQEEETRRADWERKCREIHDLLVEQEKEFSHERADLDAKLTKLNHDLGNEDKALRELEKGVIEQRGRLDLKNQLLNQMRQGIARSAQFDDGSKMEVEKLARDLATLERTLQETKALRLQKQETYSLVPYQGKRGEGRRPVYVECTVSGLVFHPEEQRLNNHDFSTAAFRAEVQRRGILLIRDQHDPERPSRPPAPPPATAYVLFLVRPDGLESYYEAVAALRGFDLDFGYEFVDAEWVFDFAQASQLAATPPVPRTDTPRPLKPPPLPEPRYAGIGYPAKGGGTPRGNPWEGAGSDGQEASGSSSGKFGPPGSAVAASGSNDNRFGPIEEERGTLGSGYPFARAAQGQPATGLAPRLGPIVGNPVNGTANGVGSPALAPNGEGAQIGAVPGVGLAVNNGDSSASARGPGSPIVSGTAPSNGTGQPASAGQALSQDVSWRGSPGATPQAAGSASGSSVAQGTDAGAGGGQRRAPAHDETGAESGSPDPLARLSPPLPFDVPRVGPVKASPPPSLGRLFANRDYVLTIECFADVVAVYPSSQVFKAANGPQQDNMDAALVQAVRQLITRRQATVRAGEAPYRPMLRFQVHPDALRTYFHVYPLFEGFHIPMARENLPS